MIGSTWELAFSASPGVVVQFLPRKEERVGNMRRVDRYYKIDLSVQLTLHYTAATSRILVYTRIHTYLVCGNILLYGFII